jgi:plastocyanin
VEILWETAQNIWDQILEITSRFVMPDWSALVGLIPLAIASLVALFLIWVVRRWSTAGPKQRGPGRLQPRPPEGVHAPGPSFAPFFGGIGLFLVFLGVVLGGWALVLGLLGLVLTGLYWLREGVTDYEHVDHTQTSLPTVVHEPPPGVHVPGPSYRPILVSLGLFVLFMGVVFGGWLLLAGLFVLGWSLLGWLRDARREYRFRVEADRTGHLATGPDPRFPAGSFAVAGLIVAVAVAVNAGIIPPTGAATGGEGSPAPSGPGGSAAPSAKPSGPVIPEADVTITAQGIKYLEASVTAPADVPFTIAFVNLDDGVPHDVDIREPGGPTIFDSEPFTGVEARALDVPPIPAGSYEFSCSIHPNMVGSLTAG